MLHAAAAASRSSLGTRLRENWGAYMLLALVVYGVKRFYSDASVEELRFVLGPTASLLEAATGAAWPFEAGVGFVSVAHNTAVVSGCAGVNFLIAAVATLVLGGVHRCACWRGKAAWFVGACALSYLATIVANTTRILADVAVRSAGIMHAVGGSHDEVHRLLGVLVYFGALSWLYHVVEAGPWRREPPCST